MTIDALVTLTSTTSIVLLDVCGKIVRLGIVAPPDTNIHRLEVWEAITGARNELKRLQAATDPDRPEDDEGLAGSRVPRPPTPKPPSLDVRLDEPKPAEDEDDPR